MTISSPRRDNFYVPIFYLQDPPPPELLCSILIAALHPHLAYISGGGVSSDQIKFHLRDAAGEATEPQVISLNKP